MKTLTFDDLRKRYESKTACVVAECSLITDIVGGQPGDRAGVANFVRHQMKLEGDAAEGMINAILSHEVAARSITPPEGEIEEQEDKGVNLIRRDEHGPWLGFWMVQACLKAAASRIGLYKQKLGTKGDMAEMGEVLANGVSIVGGDQRRIYLRGADGKSPAITEMNFFRGKVSSPQGAKNIVNYSECCPAGSRFGFEYRFYDGKITDDDIADVFASAMVIGLGSCKSFGRGKFAINKLTIDRVSRKGEAAKAKGA